MTNNIVKLRKIALVLLGYSLRVAPKSDEKGNVFIVQPKDIDEFGMLSKIYTKIVVKNFKNCNFLQKGDILFSNRSKFISTLFEEESYNTIASSGFLVIKVDNKRVIPEYLSMFLNSKYGQIEIEKQQNVGTVQSINKINFEEINVALPSLERQQKFVNLYKSYKQYQMLTKQIIDLKEKMINNIFNRCIGE